MELKEAVDKAKEFANSVFSDENPTSINLEQVVFDEMGHQWKVVLSFERFRNASTVGAALANLSAVRGPLSFSKSMTIPAVSNQLRCGRGMSSILLDTGAFLLLVVGSTKRELVERHRTTRVNSQQRTLQLLRNFSWGILHCM